MLSRPWRKVDVEKGRHCRPGGGRSKQHEDEMCPGMNNEQAGLAAIPSEGAGGTKHGGQAVVSGPHLAGVAEAWRAFIILKNRVLTN